MTDPKTPTASADGSTSGQRIWKAFLMLQDPKSKQAPAQRFSYDIYYGPEDKVTNNYVNVFDLNQRDDKGQPKLTPVQKAQFIGELKATGALGNWAYYHEKDGILVVDDVKAMKWLKEDPQNRSPNPNQAQRGFKDAFLANASETQEHPYDGVGGTGGKKTPNGNMDDAAREILVKRGYSGLSEHVFGKIVGGHSVRGDLLISDKTYTPAQAAAVIQNFRAQGQNGHGSEPFVLVQDEKGIHIGFDKSKIVMAPDKVRTGPFYGGGTFTQLSLNSDKMAAAALKPELIKPITKPGPKSEIPPLEGKGWFESAEKFRAREQAHLGESNRVQREDILARQQWTSVQAKGAITVHTADGQQNPVSPEKVADHLKAHSSVAPPTQQTKIRPAAPAANAAEATKPPAPKPTTPPPVRTALPPLSRPQIPPPPPPPRNSQQPYRPGGRYGVDGSQTGDELSFRGDDGVSFGPDGQMLASDQSPLDKSRARSAFDQRQNVSERPSPQQIAAVLEKQPIIQPPEAPVPTAAGSRKAEFENAVPKVQEYARPVRPPLIVPHPDTGEEMLNPEALSIVHTTKYPPRMDADGTALIQTTAQATGYETIRNSVHFTLNGRVSNHGANSWDGADTTIIGDFSDTVRASGVPASLNTADTYWHRGMDQPMRVPNATLVQADAQQKELVVFGERRTTFKASQFTPQDFLALEGRPDSEGRFVINKRLVEAGHTPLDFDSLQQDDTRPFAQGVLAEDAKKAAFLDGLFKAMAHEKAVKQTIVRMGYEPKAIAMHSWVSHGLDDLDKVTSLAKELGTECGTHFFTPESDLTKKLLWLDEVLTNQGSNGDDLGEILKGRYIEDRILPMLESCEPETRAIAMHHLEKHILPKLAKMDIQQGMSDDERKIFSVDQFGDKVTLKPLPSQARDQPVAYLKELIGQAHQENRLLCRMTECGMQLQLIVDSTDSAHHYFQLPDVLGADGQVKNSIARFVPAISDDAALRNPQRLALQIPLEEAQRLGLLPDGVTAQQLPVLVNETDGKAVPRANVLGAISVADSTQKLDALVAKLRPADADSGNVGRTPPVPAEPEITTKPSAADTAKNSVKDIVTAHYAGEELAKAGIRQHPKDGLVSVRIPRDHPIANDPRAMLRLQNSLGAFLEAHGFADNTFKVAGAGAGMGIAPTQSPEYYYIEITLKKSSDLETVRALVGAVLSEGNTGLTADQTRAAAQQPYPEQLKVAHEQSDDLIAIRKKNAAARQQQLDQPHGLMRMGKGFMGVAGKLDDISGKVAMGSNALRTVAYVTNEDYVKAAGSAASFGVLGAVQLHNRRMMGAALQRDEAAAEMAVKIAGALNGKLSGELGQETVEALLKNVVAEQGGGKLAQRFGRETAESIERHATGRAMRHLSELATEKLGKELIEKSTKEMGEASAKLVAKRIPLIGAFVTAGFTLYSSGAEAARGNGWKAGSELLAGSAESLGNLVCVGDVTRQMVVETQRRMGVDEDKVGDDAGLVMVAKMPLSAVIDLQKGLIDQNRIRNAARIETASYPVGEKQVEIPWLERIPDEVAMPQAVRDLLPKVKQGATDHQKAALLYVESIQHEQNKELLVSLASRDKSVFPDDASSRKELENVAEPLRDYMERYEARKRILETLAGSQRNYSGEAREHIGAALEERGIKLALPELKEVPKALVIEQKKYPALFQFLKDQKIIAENPTTTLSQQTATLTLEQVQQIRDAQRTIAGNTSLGAPLLRPSEMRDNVSLLIETAKFMRSEVDAYTNGLRAASSVIGQNMQAMENVRTILTDQLLALETAQTRLEAITGAGSWKLEKDQLVYAATLPEGVTPRMLATQLNGMAGADAQNGVMLVGDRIVLSRTNELRHNISRRVAQSYNEEQLQQQKDMVANSEAYTQERLPNFIPLRPNMQDRDAIASKVEHLRKHDGSPGAERALLDATAELHRKEVAILSEREHGMSLSVNHLMQHTNRTKAFTQTAAAHAPQKIRLSGRANTLLEQASIYEAELIKTAQQPAGDLSPTMQRHLLLLQAMDAVVAQHTAHEQCRKEVCSVIYPGWTEHAEDVQMQLRLLLNTAGDKGNMHTKIGVVDQKFKTTLTIKESTPALLQSLVLALNDNRVPFQTASDHVTLDLGAVRHLLPSNTTAASLLPKFDAEEARMLLPLPLTQRPTLSLPSSGKRP